MHKSYKSNTAIINSLVMVDQVLSSHSVFPTYVCEMIEDITIYPEGEMYVYTNKPIQ